DARLEHDLLAIAHLDAFLLEREEKRRLHHVETERHAGHALALQNRLDLACGLLEKSRRGWDGATHAHHARETVIGTEPRRVDPMVPRRRAEVPDPRLAVAGEQRVADELVAGPLADDGARDVAHVVLVEHEERAHPAA